MTTESHDDHKPAPPLGLGSSEGLGPLVPCPLCGANKGYSLAEGSTYRWWSLLCADCGQETAEARANYPAETTLRTLRADAEWNAAGKHAQELRTALQQAVMLLGHDDDATAWRDRWQHL